jgi:hypothetical protein
MSNTITDTRTTDNYFDEVGTDSLLTGIDGGDTKIVFDPQFYSTLDKLGIEINTAGAATLGDDDDSFRLPITGGDIDAAQFASLSGELEHYGSGMSFSRGGVTVELDDLVLNTETHQISGDTMVRGMDTPNAPYDEEPVLFTMDDNYAIGATNDEQVESGNLILDDVRIILTDEAARLMNLAFGTDEMSDHTLVGTATIRVDTT